MYRLAENPSNGPGWVYPEATLREAATAFGQSLIAVF